MSSKCYFGCPEEKSSDHHYFHMQFWLSREDLSWLVFRQNWSGMMCLKAFSKPSRASFILMGIKRCQVHQYATLSDNTFTAFFHDQMLLLIVYQTWLFLMITDPWAILLLEISSIFLNAHQEITISIISVLLSSQNQKYCSQCQITSLGFFLLFPFFFVPVSSQNHQFFLPRIATFFRVEFTISFVYLHTQFFRLVPIILRPKN